MSYRLLLVALVALCAFVATGCGQYGKVDTGGEASPDGQVDATPVSDKPFDAAAQKTAGCTKIEDRPDFGRDHTDDIKKEIKYDENPPTSGEHGNELNKAPVSWGIYDDSIREEAFVHNLEHGHIAVLYKGISKDEVAELKRFVRKDPYHIVMSPRSKNPKDGIFYLAWRKRLYCEKPSPEAWQAMLDLRDQAPELFTLDEEKKKDDDN